MIFALLLILLIFLKFTFLLGGGKYLSPSFLINLTLLLPVSIYALNFDFFVRDISLITFLVVVLGLSFILLGEFFARICLYNNQYSNKLNDSNQYKEICISNKVLFISLLFIAFVTLLSYNHFMKIGSSMGTDNVLAAYALVRVYYVDEANLENIETFDKPFYHDFFDILANAIALIFTYYFLYNKVILKKSSYWYLLPMVLYSPALFFTTGRMSFVAFFIQIISLYALLTYKVCSNKVTNRKYLRLAVIISIFAILVFKIAGDIRGGKYLNNQNFESTKLRDDICIYVASPIYGLDTYLLAKLSNEHNDSNKLFASNTFAGFYEILRFAGINIPNVPKHQKSYVWENGSSNVYTGFKNDIEDYGLGGFGIYLFIIGFICGIFYLSVISSRCNPQNCIPYIILAKLYYPIIFYFYVDDFYSMTSVSFLSFIFCLYISMFFLIKRTKNESNNIIS